MKKILLIILLFVFAQNVYSFNLCSPVDSDHSQYAYLNDLSEEEIIKEIVDNTYEDEIGIISWIKNVISYVRKTKSEKLGDVVSKIIVWDKNFSDEKIIENNVNNIKKIMYKAMYEGFKRAPLFYDIDSEGFDLSLISDLESFVKYMEENLEEDVDEIEVWIDLLNNQNPLFYALSIDNVILSKVFFDKGIKLQDCLYDRGFYYNYLGQKDFFDGPILIVLAGIGYNSFNLFLDNYCTDINTAIIDDGEIDGFRLIEFAVVKGYVDIVKKLLEMGAHNRRYEGGEGVFFRGALLLAVELNNLEMIKLLIENGVDVNDHNEDGSALFIAIKNNYKDIARYLVENGAYIEDELLFLDCDENLKKYIENNIEYRKKVSLLHRASLLGQFDKVKELLDLGSDPNVKDIYGRTPFHIVIANSSFIKRDSFSRSVESSASFDDYINIFDLLLKYGANVNEIDLCGNTPLIYDADMLSECSFFNYLLKNGADIKIVNDKDFSALAFIAKHFRYRNIFLNMDELISVEDYSNFNLVYYMSVFYENYSLQGSCFPFIYDEYNKKLIEEVFDNDFLNNRYHRDGLNLLHIAVLNSNKFMTNYWIENGFDINFIDLEGKSVLFFVKNIDMAKKVLELGIDFKIKDLKGRTAIDYLKEIGLAEVVEFLKSHIDSNID